MFIKFVIDFAVVPGLSMPPTRLYPHPMHTMD